MTWTARAPSTLDYFAALVAQDDGLPLLEAVAAVALDEYPELDLQAVLDDVERLLQRLRRRLPADAGSLQRLRLLNHYFFRELGFSGPDHEWDDPDLSYLHLALRRRRGLPITLGVLWLELARGIGLRASGVNFPGHFLVKVQLLLGQVVVDPLTGQSLSREELAERLEPYKRRQGLVGDFDVPVELFLQPAAARDIVARVLRNLKEIHRLARDWPRLLAVCERLVRVLPDDWAERRDRGLTWAELGQLERALADLEGYLRHQPDADDAEAVALRVQALRLGLG
ncbi:Transglutaminase-like superfamily protein [Tepidimonas alkaliphilus]|uniref:Transglutaminase-like superfamily protein n=1 Tax=Tepidimonas alkaliphilus TaxID=2588942 RepID=A0A554W573_9BURK|nr:tetratricopeptide repeat protein [Tepidimonas alkaliphilus]TSE18728.1 Transglutaminase-like superfamily protein [Tepidimonas alkaliphilus]